MKLYFCNRLYLILYFLLFFANSCGILNTICNPDHVVHYAGTLKNQTTSTINLNVCISGYNNNPYQFTIAPGESYSHEWAQITKKADIHQNTDPVTGNCPNAPDVENQLNINLMRADAQTYKICGNTTPSIIILKTDTCPQSTTEISTTCD